MVFTGFKTIHWTKFKSLLWLFHLLSTTAHPLEGCRGLIPADTGLEANPVQVTSFHIYQYNDIILHLSVGKSYQIKLPSAVAK